MQQRTKGGHFSLVTVKETIDVPKDNISNLLILLWRKAALNLRDRMWS